MLKKTPKQMSKVLLIALATTALSGCFVTPKVIQDSEHAKRAQFDLEKLYKSVEPLNGPLTMSEAISRGLLYNFDYKMGMMEEVLQNNQLTLANFNMLPRLAANAGYGWRDSERATQSISLDSGVESLEPSYSEERVRGYGDLSFSWNILDFGLSYFQAKQQADRVLSAVEKRRRVMNNMVKEIKTSYWKALSAQQLLPQVRTLIVNVDQALADSKEIENRKLQSPMKTLQYRKGLLTMIKQLKQLESDLSIAKSQLAALINLPAGQEFNLIDGGEAFSDLPVLRTSIESLQNYSLIYRPELREGTYQERIDRQNINKEIIRLFPGLSLLGSTNFDTNKYLAFQNWEELGVRATWNLIALLQGPKALESAEMQADISEMRRVALSAAVMSQVAISYNQYIRAAEGFKTAQELSDIEKQVLKVSQDAGLAQAGTKMEEIEKTAGAIAAQLERNNALAEAQSAYANLLVSVGVDLLPSATDAKTLPEMISMVRQSIADLNEGGMERFINQPIKTEQKYEAPKVEDIMPSE